MLVIINAPTEMNHLLATGLHEIMTAQVPFSDRIAIYCPSKTLACERRPTRASIQHYISELRELVQKQPDPKCVIALASGIWPHTLSSIRQALSPLDSESYTFTVWPESDADISEFYEQLQRHGDCGFPVRYTPTQHKSRDAQELARRIHAIIFEAIELKPVDPDWSRQFRIEKENLLSAVKGHDSNSKQKHSTVWPSIEAVDLQHIGSTAIPEIPAKPILDMLLGIPDLRLWKAILPALLENEYTFLDYPENSTRRFLRKGIPRTHHLHVVERGGNEWRDHIDFRDALIHNQADRDAYRQLKLKLSGQYKNRRALYGQLKGEFIKKTLCRWRNQNCGSFD